MIARLIISPALAQRVKEINKILSLDGLTPNHPDLLYFPDDSKLGIAEARKIKEHFSFKPYQAKGKAVVLEDASELTDEAQNALLKTLEELPENAIFILGADSDSKLLPTVVSRCEVITFESGHYDTLVYHSKYGQDLENLLNSSIEERFEYIEKLKDREEFLYFLVRYFRNKLIHLSSARGTNVQVLSLKEFLKELLQAEEWSKQNVAIRAILEYLMLVMPQKVW